MDKITQQRDTFNHAYKEREGIYQQIMQNAGMPEIPYRILYAVCEEMHDWSQIDICREWNYAKQSVNTAISKLIKMGYVCLLQDKKVQRNRKIIKLTEHGEEFCDQWVRPVLEADKKAFSSLSEEEREQYISIMHRECCSVRNSLKHLLDFKE